MAVRGQQNTYLMPASPAKGRRGSADYRPSIRRALGNVPACLVNASVTYCGNDQIYAFGGFDQFTDEGQLSVLCCLVLLFLPIKPCASLFLIL